MNNCPNCGAVVSIYDKRCPYCGRQNHITIDDILNTSVKGGYISEEQVYEDIDIYRDANGRLHRAVAKPKRVVTIIEK